ncbi:MAG TPA: hypothetical protein VM938_03965 [Acidimicrobiales bacterium]|nr:hypothetical protein [Acidimicrobiales bacterium]
MKQRRYSHASAVVAAIVGLSAWLVPASPAAAAGSLSIDRVHIDFGAQRVGTYGGVERLTVTATGEAVDIESVDLVGGSARYDFTPVDPVDGATDCWSDSVVTLAVGESCVVDLVFWPDDDGRRTSTLQFATDAESNPSLPVAGFGTVGYFIAGSAGQVANFGDANDLGDVSHLPLNSPIVGMAATPNGEGFWLAAADGGVFAFGNARFLGSKGGQPLNQPIVGMAATPDGAGYWLVAADGGIFTFGTAPFLGSKGGQPLNQPIVGMAADPWGAGYWLVARDGGIFTFGDVPFHGSKGGQHLNQPMVAMGATPTGDGYHTLALDGGVFTFGDAEFHGSKGGQPLNALMVGMAETPTGHGYWTVAADGGIFTFGDAPFHGSLGHIGVDDVITMAGTAPPAFPAMFGLASAAAADGGRAPRQVLPESRRTSS